MKQYQEYNKALKEFTEYKKGINNKIAAFEKDIQEKERPRSEIKTFLDLAEQSSIRK